MDSLRILQSKVDPKSVVLFKIIDLVKTKLHGDKFVEYLATGDNVMIHIDESTVDTVLKILFSSNRWRSLWK